MMINENECHAAGLDPKEVERIARGLSRYGKQAEQLGLQIFGGGTGGSLRRSGYPNWALIIAHLDGNFDGGDGACAPDDEGLLRGEYA